MHIDTEVVGSSGAKTGDVEQIWRDLHHCHLLMEVGRHGLFTKDHHRAGCVDSQKILLGTPLRPTRRMEGIKKKSKYSIHFK